MRSLVLIFSLALFFYCSSAQVDVPLIPFDGSNITLQQGAFTPNGTLLAGNYAYFKTNVPSVPSGYGISVYVTYFGTEYESNSTNSSYTTVRLYLKKGSSASALNYDQISYGDCFTDPCTNPAVIGQCNPSTGDWYFSIYNSNQVAVIYQLDVAIDIYGGGTIFDCNAAAAAGAILSTILIVIIVIVAVVILGAIICVVVCCCVCAGGVAAATAASTRSGRETTVVQHSYIPVPQNGPYYPPPGAQPNIN